MLLSHALLEAAASVFGGSVAGIALALLAEPDIGPTGLLGAGAAGAVILSSIVLTRAQAAQNQLAAKTQEAIAEKFAETTQIMAREARESHETCTGLIMELVSKTKQ